MPFWRRGETVNEKLAREAGLDTGSTPRDEPRPEPLEAEPRWRLPGYLNAVGVHGVPRSRRWDAVASAAAPGLPGDSVHFVALPDGTLVVDEAVPDGALEALAAAVERELDAPYRAEAIRQEERVWAVAANRIDVLELPEEIPGDELELSVMGSERSLVVAGEPSLAELPTLEDWGAAQHQDYVVRGERLDGDVWELRLTPL
ncbi:MAG: hypothetical protein ABR583_09385 [Gaiellaceae bacterium]